MHSRLVPTVPPPAVRYRIVNQHQSEEEFLRLGSLCASNLRRALDRLGRPIETFERVLDFGCGCGRVLLQFADLWPTRQWTGCDIDPVGINWCRENFADARFLVTPELPPTPFPDASFDLIYAISVFTHLDASRQEAWLEEARRLLAPGGLLVFSTHGDHQLQRTRAQLPADALHAYELRGHCFVENITDGVLPAWYQTTYQTEAYLRTHTSRWEFLEFLPRGMNSQDLTVLQRPAEETAPAAAPATGSSPAANASAPEEAPRILPAACLSSLPMPPPEIRYRIVNRVPSEKEFLEIGWLCQQSILARLAEAGRTLDSFASVLDWGVGCARVLRHFEPHFGGGRFHGSDIDAPMIAWDQAHIPGVEFKVNPALPPLPWDAGSFDFIYGISVFTHLDEPYQARWLEELQRVTRPGALVLLTTHGRHVLDLCKNGLSKEEIWAYKAKGFVYVKNIRDGVLPDWYQTTFQTEAHIRRTFAPWFRVLTHVPRGMSNYQDATLLQRND